MMEKVRELAAQYQQAGNNCAETVVKVCNDCLDLKLPPETLRMVSVLGGGVAGSGCLCGALNGACLVLAVSSAARRRRKRRSRSQSACAGIPENLARPLPCDVLPRPQESGQRRSRIVRRLMADTSAMLIDFIREKKLADWMIEFFP